MLDEHLRKAEDCRIWEQRLGERIVFKKGDLVRVVEQAHEIVHQDPWTGLVEEIKSPDDFGEYFIKVFHQDCGMIHVLSISCGDIISLLAPNV